MLGTPSGTPRGVCLDSALFLRVQLSTPSPPSNPPSFNAVQSQLQTPGHFAPHTCRAVARGQYLGIFQTKFTNSGRHESKVNIC